MSTATSRRALPRHATAAAAAVLVLSLGLVGCQPEPEPTPIASPSGEPSPSGSTPTPTTTPTPTQPAQAGEEIALPTACEQIYSPEMLATLTAQNPPLNDAGVTMTSTQNVEALELLSSGIPTIRCSWGMPSEYGLATNVSIVDASQSAALTGALANAGFACEQLGEATVCRSDQTVIDLDDNIVELGETHVLRGNAWIATATIDFAPQGYTEDIIATLWG
jgi:hypothetical protein